MAARHLIATETTDDVTFTVSRARKDVETTEAGCALPFGPVAQLSDPAFRFCVEHEGFVGRDNETDLAARLDVHFAAFFNDYPFAVRPYEVRVGHAAECLGKFDPVGLAVQVDLKMFWAQSD